VQASLSLVFSEKATFFPVLFYRVVRILVKIDLIITLTASFLENYLFAIIIIEKPEDGSSSSDRNCVSSVTELFLSIGRVGQSREIDTDHYGTGSDDSSNGEECPFHKRFGINFSTVINLNRFFLTYFSELNQELADLP
jgi:hypothetical protein